MKCVQTQKEPDYSMISLLLMMILMNLSRVELLWKGNWFIQEKSCKILALIVSARPKTQDDLLSNGEASNSKSKIICVDDVLKGLVEWFCAQLKKPSNPSRYIPTAISCLATLLKEPLVRSLFVQGDGVKLLILFVLHPPSNLFSFFMKHVSVSGYCLTMNLLSNTWLLQDHCHD
ncbi:hypothetical protein Peur_025148 [Populus x canadensis]